MDNVYNYPPKLWREGGMAAKEALTLTPTMEGGSMKVRITTPRGNESDVIMSPKVYSTGTRGYHGTGKVQDGEKKYQLNFQVYEVGSKPAKKK